MKYAFVLFSANSSGRFSMEPTGMSPNSGTSIPTSLASVIIANSFSGTLGNLGDGSFTIHWPSRSEEHTSELQSQSNLVCRLLLEKKKKKPTTTCCAHTPAPTSYT